jgi:hypothetical protein
MFELCLFSIIMSTTHLPVNNEIKRYSTSPTIINLNAVLRTLEGGGSFNLLPVNSKGGNIGWRYS